MKRRVIVVSVVALLAALMAFKMTASAAKDTTGKGINVQELARVGIQLSAPLDARKLTEAEVIAAAKKAVPLYMEQATSVTVQRVMYGAPGSLVKQPAWMVTMEGLNIPSRGPRGVATTYNTQLHLILDDLGQPLVSYTHQ